MQELSTCSVCLFLCFGYFVSWFDFCFIFSVFGLFLCPLFLWVIVCFRSLLLHKATLYSPNIGMIGSIKEVDYGTVPPFRRSPFTSMRKSEKKDREKKEIDVRAPRRTLGIRHLFPIVASGALTTSSFFSADYYLTRATDFSEKEGLLVVHFK